MISADQPRENPVLVKIAEPGEDVELKAIAYVQSVLTSLPVESHQRVLDYLYSRLPNIFTFEGRRE
jgi:hypothetical protein